jgi:hypothetical protein
MIPKLFFTVVITFALFVSVSAQSPCENPFPDACHNPDTCCVIPWDNCPWQLNSPGLDVVVLVGYFKGGYIAPGVYSKYDFNCNCVVNGLDVAYMISYLKGHGPAPKCCFYQCTYHPWEGTIGNWIWHDENRNGIQDSNESGMPYMWVSLTNCSDPPSELALDTTDANGFYSFDGLAPGSYRIHLLHTDEFYYSPKDQGSDDQIDSDADPQSGFTDCFEIERNAIDNSRDIGIYWPRSVGDIGDFVWNDLDQDGIQDPGESGLVGITLSIYNRYDSALVATTITDQDGHYMFRNLYSGYYYIRVIPQVGFVFSPQDQGSNDSIDSDVNPATGIMTGDELYEDHTVLTWDAGMYQEHQGEGCTRTLTYWRIYSGLLHQPDSVSHHLPLWLGLPDSTKSIHITTLDEARKALWMLGYGNPLNGITRLYAQLLAAKLNIANGASDNAIAETIISVDLFLSNHNWHDNDNLDGNERQLVYDWRNTLFGYNHGIIGPGRCHDDDGTD